MVFYKIDKGVAIVSRVICLQILDLRNHLSCECSLVWRDSCLGYELRLHLTMQGLPAPLSWGASRRRDIKLYKSKSAETQTFAEAHCTSEAAGAGCRDRATRLPELRTQSCTGGGQSQQPQRFLYLTNLGKSRRYMAVFTFSLLDMPCGGLRRGITLLEGLLLPFCCLWLSLTCTFPCWGNPMNILRLTPCCKKEKGNTYINFSSGD